MIAKPKCHDQAHDNTTEFGTQALKLRHSMPKVAILMPLGEQRGGAEMMLLHLLRANKCGENVPYLLIFLEGGPLVKAARDLGYPVEVISAGRLRNVLRFCFTIVKIVAALKRHKCRAIVSWMAKGHFYGGPAALLAGIPSSWFLHSIPERNWFDLLVTRIPTKMVFCCGATAAAAQQRLSPRRDTKVMYIAVDLDRFDPSRVDPLSKDQIVKADGECLVGMVARLQRWKGVHTFVEAAALTARRIQNVRFVVVGGEHWSELDYVGELNRMISEAGLTSRFVLAGQQENVPSWMNSMDIVVHSSYNEPAGMVILEAMALGKAVVAAKTPGPSEFVNDGQDGVLVEPGKPQLLADAISRFVEDPVFRERLGASARMRAAQFSTTQLARNMAEALSSLMR